MDEDGRSTVTVVEAASSASVEAMVEVVRGLLDDDLTVLVTGTDREVLDQVAARFPAPAPPARTDPYQWLPLPVRGECPLTADDLRRLVVLEARHTLERERRGAQAFPDEDSLPTAAEVRDLADRVARGTLAARQLDPSLRDLLERPDADELLQAIRDLNVRLGELLGRGRAWVVRIADRALADPEAAAWTELAEHAASIDRVIAAHAELRGTLVEGVTGGESALRAVRALAERLGEGEPLRRRFRGRVQRAAAPHLDPVLIDGEPVRDAAAVQVVRTALEAQAQVATLHAELSPYGVPVPTEGPRDTVVAELVGIREALRAVERLVVAAHRLDELVGSATGPEEGSAAAATFELRSLDDVDRIKGAGDALVALRDGERARRDLEAAAGSAERFGAAVDGREPAREPAPELGELVLCLRAGDATAYAEWLDRLELGRRSHRLAALRTRLRERLAGAAPGLVDAIAQDPAEETWKPRLAQWEPAWEWARAASAQLPAAPVRVLPPEELATDVTTGGVDVAVVHDPEGCDPERWRDLASRVVVLTPPPPDRPADAPASQPDQQPDQPDQEPDQQPSQQPGGPDQVVLALAAAGPVSGPEVRAATGLSAARTRTLLKRLVDEGRLVRTGATSATRWHLP